MAKRLDVPNGPGDFSNLPPHCFQQMTAQGEFVGTFQRNAVEVIWEEKLTNLDRLVICIAGAGAVAAGLYFHFFR